MLHHLTYGVLSATISTKNDHISDGVKGEAEGMAHMAKMTKAVVGHMAKHYERAKDEDGNYIKFGNQDIDQERTHLNYNLAEHQAKMQGEFIRERCGEVRTLNRKDVNVACSWVVTLPSDFKGNNPEKGERDFFEGTYQFLEDRYGRDNVVSAYVHMDEATPHMHFCFVPVVEDKKRDGFKLSAKECVNRADLQTFHTDLQNFLLDEREIDCSILNGATANGNLTVEELKAKTLEELNQEEAEKFNELAGEVTELEGKRLEAHTDVLRLKGEADKLEEKIKALRGEKESLGDTVTTLEERIPELRGEFKVVKERVDEIKAEIHMLETKNLDVKSINPEKTITGAIKGITVEQVENLKNIAIKYQVINDKYRELLEEKKELQKYAPTTKSMDKWKEEAVKERFMALPQVKKAYEEYKKNPNSLEVGAKTKAKDFEERT